MAEIKVADLIAEIKFRDEKFKKELNDLRRSVDKRTDQMVNEFKKVERKGLISFKKLARGAALALGGIIAFVAARGLFRGFQRIVSLASDTTESMNKVKEVFGKAAGSVINFSQKAATALGASTQEALEMTGEIGNLLVAMGSTEEAAAKMSTDIVLLASDLGSFNNVPTVDALNAIRSALIGETEPMRRFGSNVSAARVETLALSKGISKAALATDEMMKAQFRLEIIFKDTTKAQGDFARTSNDFANVMKTLGALFNDAAAELGNALIPQLTEFAVQARDFITSTKFDIFIENLATKFGELAGFIGNAVTELVKWISAANMQTVGDMIDELKQLNSELGTLKTRLSEGNLFEKNFPEKGQLDALRKVLGEDVEVSATNAGNAILFVEQRLEALQKRIDSGEVSLSDLLNPKVGTDDEKRERGTREIEPLGDPDAFRTKFGNIMIPIPIVPFFDDVSKTALEEEVSEIEKFLEAQLFLDPGLDDLTDDLQDSVDAAEKLDRELKNVARQLGAATDSAEEFLKALIRIALQKLALRFAGPVGIGFAFLSEAFAGGGGGRVGPSGHIQAAFGLSGRVPQGFQNDQFLIGVSSGENVDIKTPAQSSASNRAQRELSGAIQALSVNVSRIRSEQADIFAMVSIEDRELQLTVEKAQRRDLRFKG